MASPQSRGSPASSSPPSTVVRRKPLPQHAIPVSTLNPSPLSIQEDIPSIPLDRPASLSLSSDSDEEPPLISSPPRNSNRYAWTPFPMLQTVFAVPLFVQSFLLGGRCKSPCQSPDKERDPSGNTGKSPRKKKKRKERLVQTDHPGNFHRCDMALTTTCYAVSPDSGRPITYLRHHSPDIRVVDTYHSPYGSILPPVPRI